MQVLTTSDYFTVVLTPSDDEIEPHTEEMTLVELLDLPMEDYDSVVVRAGHYSLLGKDLTVCSLIDEMKEANDDGDKLELFIAFAHNQHYEGVTYSDCTDRYIGDFDNGAEAMESVLEEQVAEIAKVNDDLARHIDYQSYWDSIGTHGYYEIEGHYFENT